MAKITQNLEPFDYSRYQAGEKVVTRGGEAVAQVHLFETCADNSKIRAVIDGRMWAYSAEGQKSEHGEHSLDLFMAPKRRGVYHNLGDIIGNVPAYSSLGEAIKEALDTETTFLRLTYSGNLLESVEIGQREKEVPNG